MYFDNTKMNNNAILYNNTTAYIHHWTLHFWEMERVLSKKITVNKMLPCVPKFSIQAKGLFIKCHKYIYSNLNLDSWNKLWYE